MMLEFMLDAAPGPECDVALLIFYPAFSQISSKRKDENAGFLQNLGETWCGGSGQRQHGGCLKMALRLAPVYYSWHAAQTHGKVLELPLAVKSFCLAWSVALAFVLRSFSTPVFSVVLPWMWHCSCVALSSSVSFSSSYFYLSLSVLSFTPAETKRPLWL